MLSRANAGRRFIFRHHTKTYNSIRQQAPFSSYTSLQIYKRIRNFQFPIALKNALHFRQITVQATTSQPRISTEKQQKTIERAYTQENELIALASRVSTALAHLKEDKIGSRWSRRINDVVNRSNDNTHNIGIVCSQGKDAEIAALITKLALSDQTKNGESASSVFDRVLEILNSSNGAISEFDMSTKPSNKDDSNDSKSESHLCRPVRVTYFSSDPSKYPELFYDWVFSCDRIVIVAAESRGLLEKLGNKGPLSKIFNHPDIVFALNGIDLSSVGPYSDLLSDSVKAINLDPLSDRGRTHIDVILPDDTTPDNIAMIQNRVYRRNAIPNALIACTINAALDSLEKDIMHSTTSTSSISGNSTPNLGSTLYRIAGSGTALSEIQKEFEDTDLRSLDTSVGKTKRQIHQWIASGKQWQALLMRVHESVDSLVEDAILNQFLEDFDLSMVHATGVLNEAVKRLASEGSRELEGLSHVSSGAAPSQSDFAAAANSLKIASMSKALPEYALSQYVWETRNMFAERAFVNRLPDRIRWYIAGFWGIQSLSVVAPVSVALFYGISVAYAPIVSVILSAISAGWLGSRWNKIGSDACAEVDRVSARLKEDISTKHKEALETHLGIPVRKLLEKINSGDSANKNTAPLIYGPDPEIVKTWRLQINRLLHINQ